MLAFETAPALKLLSPLLGRNTAPLPLGALVFLPTWILVLPLRILFVLFTNFV